LYPRAVKAKVAPAVRFSLQILLVGLAFLFLNASLLAQVSFAPATNCFIVSDSAPFSVAAADVNGDGKADLICANINNNFFSVLTNKGGGIFGTNGNYVVGNSSDFLVAADINGDGKMDVICARGSANRFVVFTNDGAGIFGSNGTYFPGNYPTSIVVADVNGDGKPDLVTANWGLGAGNTLTVLTNNGNGIFGSNATLVVGLAPSSVTAADVNGDGKLDLICANSQTNSLSVLTNDGVGNFTVASTPGVSSPFSVAAADVNGDGKIDLITADATHNTVSVLTNDGSGGFSPSFSTGVGAVPRSMTLADVNGDGKVDVITANFNDNTLSVLTNDGGGGFVLAAVLNVGTNPISPVAADVNGDGRLDLICANNGNQHGGTLSVVLNTSTFLPQLTATHSGGNMIVSWASSWTGWAGWSLSQNASLNPTNWTSFNGAVGDDGTTKSVTNSLTAGNRFFRLTHP
jgi:hypothetical protein